jgi:hypothetical protein
MSLVFNDISNTNFYNGILRYDFSDSFPTYRDLFQVVEVHLSISIDSIYQKLQNYIVSTLRKY